jgi:tRNA pseudouridine38-40 synthase
VTRRNIKLVLAYDGTRYCGWQRQKNALSIQEVIESKIAIMTREAPRLTASGRTDAGVHALGQVCNFVTFSSLSPEAFQRGLNSLLPEDIFIHGAEEVSPDFHSRFAARSKRYRYRILNRSDPDIFSRNHLWHVPHPLDLPKMKRCLSSLEGTHDFSSFRSSGSGNTNPVRRIHRAELTGPQGGLLYITMEADGFLRHMVRNVVGTLVEIGRGKTEEERFIEILESRDRRSAGFKAPPQGLYLVEVFYGE